MENAHDGEIEVRGGRITSKTTELFKGSTGTRPSALALPTTQVEGTFRGELRDHLPTALGLTILVTLFFNNGQRAI